MRLVQVLVGAITVLATPLAARYIERSGLEGRDNIGDCKATLIALKASAFCSSFVPIQDVTLTSTRKAPNQSTQTTVTDACTNPIGKRAATTAVIKSLSSKQSLTSLTISSKKPLSTCASQGVPTQVASFPCDIIKEACLAFVRPRTTTVTTIVPGTTITGTKTVTPTCPPTKTSSTTTSSAPASSPTCDVEGRTKQRVGPVDYTNPYPGGDNFDTCKAYCLSQNNAATIQVVAHGTTSVPACACYNLAFDQVYEQATGTNAFFSDINCPA